MCTLQNLLPRFSESESYNLDRKTKLCLLYDHNNWLYRVDIDTTVSLMLSGKCLWKYFMWDFKSMDVIVLRHFSSISLTAPASSLSRPTRSAHYAHLAYWAKTPRKIMVHSNTTPFYWQCSSLVIKWAGFKTVFTYCVANAKQMEVEIYPIFSSQGQRECK